jgi:2-polyprenyl-3-methyl-5-hydroxy-6-metoxy-1,4-benzoquinol methylase
MISSKIIARLHGNVAVTRCHMCRKRTLRLVLDLGFQPHSDDFLTPERLSEPEVLYPLRLVQCGSCGLLQIDYRVDPEILYGINYAYQTSANVSGVAHYHAAASHIADKCNLKPRSRVIDIGSNVGVLLEGFKKEGHTVLGIEPAQKIARIARKRGIRTLNEFFSATFARALAKKERPVDLITFTNVFAHLHDVHDGVKGVTSLLKKTGSLVIEAPSALELIRSLEYDTIYHQHIAYLSVKPMAAFFKSQGLELYDVEEVAIHGGTLRYYVGWKGAHAVSNSVARHIASEKKFGLYDKTRLARFARDVAAQKTALQELLLRLNKQGKKVAAMSAPAKGNTLLNYCHIDRQLLAYAVEKNELKVGTYTPGTYIPVVGEDVWRKDPPDYALVLAWNFAGSIMARYPEFKKRGGRWIVPVPRPTIK